VLESMLRPAADAGVTADAPPAALDEELSPVAGRRFSR